METYIVDRFEQDKAVIEASEEGGAIRFFTLERAILPADTREGDVLVQAGETWQRDIAATQARRQRTRELLARLTKNKPTE